MEEWWKERLETFNNQIMRNVYIMLVMLDSPGSEGEIVSNFKHGISIIKIIIPFSVENGLGGKCWSQRVKRILQ